MKQANIAFIPIRSGSKSIPLKNIKVINGKPLIYWTAKAACECKYIVKVYIATDNEIIADIVGDFPFDKIEVIGRSTENATDTASTESAMLEFAEVYDFDNIALIQATSPLLTSDDLNRGFEAFEEGSADSVLSCVRQKRFNWQINENGFAKPVNYDIFTRPRRQDFDGYLVENGAFYITSKSNLLKTKNRISGNIKIIEMNEDSYFEIDEPGDWEIVECLMKNKNSVKNKNNNLKNIKIFVTDCDGVLTDAGMYYTEKGDEIKKFNARDGMAFQFLRENNIKTAIITSENNPIVTRRGKKLKVDFCVLNCKDKLTALKEICGNLKIELGDTAYIGDDINDYEVMLMCGFKACPKDAVKKIKDVCDYVSPYNGGCGAVRDVVEHLLKNRECV